jgi:hypothetical protein
MATRKTFKVAQQLFFSLILRRLNFLSNSSTAVEFSYLFRESRVHIKSRHNFMAIKLCFSPNNIMQKKRKKEKLSTNFFHGMDVPI